LNFNAFLPNLGPNQGDLPRNFIRGFGNWQADLAVSRQFHLTERFGLQFRSEFFNLFNHANFANFDNNLRDGANLFGVSRATLNMGRNTSALFGLLNSGLNSLYQAGGPRSIQLALKLQF
jgi:hypothetical protein